MTPAQWGRLWAAIPKKKAPANEDWFLRQAKAMTARQAGGAELREAFGAGPFHVEHRTNSCSEVCTPNGRTVATFSWALEAAKRAEAFCATLNAASKPSAGERGE